MILKILNKHNNKDHSKYKWVCSATGELQTNLFWVILTIIYDLYKYRTCYLKWERYK